MADWCDDCAWPHACATALACQRRETGEIRSAALPEVAAAVLLELAGAFSEAIAAGIYGPNQARDALFRSAEEDAA